MQSKVIALSAILALAALAGNAPAQEAIPGHAHTRPRLFSWVLPSDTGHYVGTYVGGGATTKHKAEGRRDDEGTWGWDYQGWIFPRRVINGYFHGQRYQGGTGAYKSDGPKLYEEK